MSHSYSETSKLFQPAFLCSFMPVMIVMIVIFFDEKAHQDTWGMIFSITGLLISGTVLVFLLLLQLTVSINEQGISFKYFPYIRTMRTYCWEEYGLPGLLHISLSLVSVAGACKEAENTARPTPPKATKAYGCS